MTVDWNILIQVCGYRLHATNKERCKVIKRLSICCVFGMVMLLAGSNGAMATDKARFSVSGKSPLLEVQSTAELFQTGVTAFQNGHKKKAFLLMQRASELGHPDAMFNLAYLYEKGIGTSQDYGKSMHWYRSAAKAGSAMAMLNIGALYENANGVKRDYKKATRWYYKAGSAFVRQGNEKGAVFAYNTLLQEAPDSHMRKQLQWKIKHAGWQAPDKLSKEWKGVSIHHND